MTLSSRMVAVLTSVGLLSGGFLAGVGLLTKERIALNKQREVEKAIMTVVPGAATSEKIFEEKDFLVFRARDGNGEIAGFAVYAAGVGFQDKIALMLGLNPDLTRINGLTILDQKETPGLGAKITDNESFLVYWENKDCAEPLRLRKPPAPSPADLALSEVNTITGATISAEAVLTVVNSAVIRVRKLNEEGKLAVGGEHGR